MRLPTRHWDWPLLTVLLGTILFADVLVLSDESTVGALKIEALKRLRPYKVAHRVCYSPTHALLIRTEDGGVVRAFPPFDGVSEETMRNVNVALEMRRLRRFGFWAPTHQTLDYRPVLIGAPEAFTRAEIDAAERWFGQEIERRDEEYFDGQGRGMATGRGAETRILWGGYARNVFSLLLAAGFIWSLDWIPVRLAAARRERRDCRGLCPVCLYDLSGIDAVCCPECGSRIERARQCETEEDR